MNLPQSTLVEIQNIGLDRAELLRIIELFKEEVRTSRQLLFSSFGASVLIPTALANAEVPACLTPGRFPILILYFLGLVLLPFSAALLIGGEGKFRRIMENVVASTTQASADLQIALAARAQIGIWSGLVSANVVGMVSLGLFILSAAMALVTFLSCEAQLP